MSARSAGRKSSDEVMTDPDFEESGDRSFTRSDPESFAGTEMNVNQRSRKQASR
jgi:hypothetical protein